jgi:hypothetical protein
MPPARIKTEILREKLKNGKETKTQLFTKLAKKQGAYIIVSGGDDTTDTMLSDRRKAIEDSISELTSKRSIAKIKIDRSYAKLLQSYVCKLAILE